MRNFRDLEIQRDPEIHTVLHLIWGKLVYR